MGRGERYPQAVQLQVRRPEPGLGAGICIDDAPIKKSSAMSWADLSSEIHEAMHTDQVLVIPATTVTPSWAEFDEIHAAVESLYRDEMKPYCRILRKRLTEQAEARGEVSLDINVELLRTQCESSTKLCVEVEESSEWSATFKGRAPTFVNVYSPQDSYPVALWASAASYFESADESNSKLPGGRYDCAQVLVARGLQFLSGRTLGEVSHIVQLAISQKKLLGYSSGAIVPYHRSQSMMKDRCAQERAPCVSLTSNAMGGGSTGSGEIQDSSSVLSVATWQVFRNLLQEILKDALASNKDHVPISNVKRIFRSRFHVDLSETALGHSKLSELLQDPRISDVCKLKLNGRGYVVVPVELASIEKLLLPGTTAARSSGDRSSVLGPHANTGCVEAMVRHTFIHFTAPSSGAKKRAVSLPKDFQSFSCKHSHMDESTTDVDTAEGSSSSDVSGISDDECNSSPPESVAIGLRHGAARHRSPSASRDHHFEIGELGDAWDTDFASSWVSPRRGRSHDVQSSPCRTPSPSPPRSFAIPDSQDLFSCYGLCMPMTFVLTSQAPQYVRLADYV